MKVTCNRRNGPWPETAVPGRVQTTTGSGTWGFSWLPMSPQWSGVAAEGVETEEKFRGNSEEELPGSVEGAITLAMTLAWSKGLWEGGGHRMRLRYSSHQPRELFSGYWERPTSVAFLEHLRLQTWVELTCVCVCICVCVCVVCVCMCVYVSACVMHACMCVRTEC